METMSSSIEPVVPRTANLLACKQWWRVCFLYGDQQKYYRQVYGKAAAQRLALSTTTTKSTKKIQNDKQNTSTSGNSDYDTITDFIEEAQLDELQDANIDNNNKHNSCNNNNNNNDNETTSHVTTKTKQKQKDKEKEKDKEKNPQVLLFPAKCQSHTTPRKNKKLLRSLRKQDEYNTITTTTTSNYNQHTRRQQQRREKKITSKELKETLEQLQTLSLEATKANARVTVLDDPFLFGIDEDHLGDLIKRKEYNINASEDIFKYFNYYVDQEAQQPQQQQDSIVEIDMEPKPALPPKKKQQRNEQNLQINQTDLEFLNYSLRNRDLPKVQPHDISFTFNEEQIEEGEKKIESLTEDIDE